MSFPDRDENVDKTFLSHFPNHLRRKCDYSFRSIVTPGCHSFDGGAAITHQAIILSFVAVFAGYCTVLQVSLGIGNAGDGQESPTTRSMGGMRKAGSAVDLVACIVHDICVH